jgi:DNA-binding NtrC family response regulator
LAEKLLEQNSSGAVGIAPGLMQWMEKQTWPGNVRELKNTLIYMDALRRGDVLDLDDVPEQNSYVRSEETTLTEENGQCRNEEDALIVLVRELLANHTLLGRRLLLEEARKRGICNTEYQLRKWLGSLEAEGKIIMGKGKVGIQLS